MSALAPASTTAAPVHHGETVGEVAGELEILFDEHDRHVAAAAQVVDGAADVLDDGGLDALRRFVEDQQLRPGHQGAADGELLLLPARQVAAAPVHHALQHGEELEHLLGHVAQRTAHRREAGVEVLLDGEQREDLASLRHVADAAPGAGVGRQAGHVLAREGDAAAADRLLAHDGAEQGGFPDAVAARARR